jgi:hypothetical protein
LTVCGRQRVPFRLNSSEEPCKGARREIG